MLPNLPRENLLELCRRMFVIRHFEENLVPLHDKGVFGGHYHLYVGQEATGVPALSCLRADDYLFTTHRNHGHLLARGVEPKTAVRRNPRPRRRLEQRQRRLVSLGRAVAGISSQLRRGRRHHSALDRHRLRVKGAEKRPHHGLPVRRRLARRRRGAGSVQSSPRCYKLPVLFLCENNGKYGAGRAVAAAQSTSMAAYPLTDLPKAYKIPAQQIDGMDAGLVHATISEAVEKIRRGEGPQFVEAQTVRFPGSETNWPTVPQPTDTALAWDVSNVPEKAREWYRSCDPLLIFIRELVEENQRQQ